MKRFMERTRLAMHESSNLSKLITAPSDDRSVVVYAEDSFSYVQLKGYLEALWREFGIRYQYVTSDSNDPVLTEPPAGSTTWYIREQLPRLLGGLECGVFLTTMPDLGRFHVPRPLAGKTVYAFHSLNSAHTAYRTGAFDNYDQFFCTGPHHVSELHGLRPESKPELSEVGYYKLDLIADQFHGFLADGREPEDDLVLLAPSWGRRNLLEAAGAEVIGSLTSEGLRVIVRPHPQFFHSLYPEGAAIVEALIAEFGGHPLVSFELSIDKQDSFLASGLMISDWSGAAYEYALGTRRPVLFIDTPQKIFNDSWQDLNLPSFERDTRERVGRIVGLDQVGELGEIAGTMLARVESENERLELLVSELVFNPGRSASAGARAIAEAL